MYRRIAKTAIILALAVCVVLCTTVTASASVASPYVSGSSIDYGFVNYSIPYLETLNGQIYGYARDFSPFFYQYGGSLDNITTTTNNYYSYCASSILYPDNDQVLVRNSSYLSVMSINFSKPVYKATFRIFLGDGASFNSFTFSSFGGDNLDQWDETIQSNYAVVSIYNIEHPVKMYFRFKVGSADLSGIGFNISLATLIYQDGTAEQIANDNANTDKITSNNNANTDKITDNQDQNTQDIIDSDKENTDAIIDNQNQIVENEKNEINSSANGSVDSIMNVVPDIGIASISEGVGKIVSAMSTHSTYCQWTFPSLKIPSINGVFNEIVLMEEKTVDLSAWVNKIPDRALTLVRALCTIGIILFVVYEFIDFVLYCFTLKKNASGKSDGGDEE